MAGTLVDWLPLRETASASAAAELDADGDTDLAVAPLAGTSWCWENDGAAGFTPRSGTTCELEEPYDGVELLGVDLDGARDVLLHHRLAYIPFDSALSAPRLFLSRGADRYERQSTRGLEVRLFGELKLGAVDGDGDLLGDHERVAGLTRHIAVIAPPNVGRPVDVQLWGPAAGAWVLAAALDEASIPVGALGIPRLDPATPVLLSSGVMPPDRGTRVTLDVPADPALVGLEAPSRHPRGTLAGRGRGAAAIHERRQRGGPRLLLIQPGVAVRRGGQFG